LMCAEVIQSPYDWRFSLRYLVSDDCSLAFLERPPRFV